MASKGVHTVATVATSANRSHSVPSAVSCDLPERTELHIQ